MCGDCVARYVLGLDDEEEYDVEEARAAIAAVPVSDEMLECRDLVESLYETEPVGGPLHVATDDYNLDDESLAFCRARVAEGDYRPGTAEIASRILDLLGPMTLAQRAVSLG